jgi:leader peptidase (prepilin peptidase)/N-methyltransferase
MPPLVASLTGLPALAYVFGLVFGSFGNVMAMRLLADQDFVKDRSRCPKCGTAIAWYDNIPLLSYVLLGGKCRHCGTGISLQYPLIEIAMATLFAWAALVFAPTDWQGLTTLAFLAFLLFNMVVATITDWHEHLIFYVNSFPLIPAGLLMHGLGLGPANVMPNVIPAVVLPGVGWVLSPEFVSALVGVLGIFLVFEGLILVTKIMYGEEGFGHGDTHLLMGLAAYLGWELTLVVFALGFMLQAVVALPMLVVGWIKNRHYKLLATSGSALVVGLLPMLGMTLWQWQGAWVSLALLVCSLVSILLLLLFLKEVRNTRSQTYMPLGPALCAGGVIALFYGKPLWQSGLAWLGLA